MRQMTAMGKWEPHDSGSWSKKTRVDREICGASTERLNIYGPLLCTQSESSESAILAK